MDGLILEGKTREENWTSLAIRGELGQGIAPRCSFLYRSGCSQRLGFKGNRLVLIPI